MRERSFILTMIRFRFVSRTVAVAALAASFALALRAQTDGPPPGPPPGDFQGGQQQGPPAERQLKHLTKLLTLTQDQQTQIKPILTEEDQQIKALFDQARAAQTGTNAQSDSSAQDNRPSPEAMAAMRTQMKALREAANVKIAALLSDTQKAKFSSWLEQQQKREAQRDQDDMPPPPPDGDGGGPPPGGGGPPPGV